VGLTPPFSPPNFSSTSTPITLPCSKSAQPPTCSLASLTCCPAGTFPNVISSVQNLDTDPSASGAESDNAQSGKRKTGVLFRISRTIPPLPIGQPVPYMVMLSTVGLICGVAVDVWGCGVAMAPTTGKPRNQGASPSHDDRAIVLAGNPYFLTWMGCHCLRFSGIVLPRFSESSWHAT